MQINITKPEITEILFTAEQLNPPVVAEGRRWCRGDDDPWSAWTVSGNLLKYQMNVPVSLGIDTGYELRFALQSAGFEDPKVIISRKGQGNFPK
jgi:hypothetical protein